MSIAWDTLTDLQAHRAAWTEATKRLGLETTANLTPELRACLIQLAEQIRKGKA